jgi:sortase (surface protein transpeptidase)
VSGSGSRDAGETGSSGSARRGRPAARAQILLAAAIALDVLLAVTVPLVAATPGPPARELAASAATQRPTASSTVSAAGAAGRFQDPAAPSTRSVTGTPVRIEIPAIHVDASLQRLHRDDKGVLQPPDSWTEAGWYAGGVVPGAVGPAVIAGHLDTTKRVAVFVDLRLLRPGDRVRVILSTRRAVSFVVTRARVVRKALFPTAEVYGPTPDAQLRLITCSEPFDEARGIYADNLVVFATKAG